MKDKRPVNLDIGSMRLPVTAWTSISHRVSGVLLFVGMAVFMWLLDSSLRSPEGFEAAAAWLSSPLVKGVVWIVLVALIYHALAGVRHLIMDFGVGESFEGGVRSAHIVIVLAVLLSLLAGVWLW